MKKFLLIGGLMALPFTSFADVLFDQSTGIEVDGYFSDAISTNGSQWYAQAVADNFSLASDSTISKISFWGASENFEFDDFTNMLSFDFEILDASYNTVASWTQSTASLTPTATGAFGTTTGSTGYVLTANVNQSLAAGNYFLHVGATLDDPFGDAFAWSTVIADGSISGNFFDGNGWASFATGDDVAFKIEGTTNSVPEPASLAVLGLGAFAMIRRRKK